MDHQLDEAEREPDGLPARAPRAARAIADTLFGKVNPSGRLPVSWPKDSSSFPLAYNEAGKPYDPRFPFGYGLSYTRFKLDDLRAPWHASPGQRISASVDVANVGRQRGRRTRSWPSSSPATAAGASWPSTASTRGRQHRRATARLTFSARRAPTSSSSATSAGPSGSAEAQPAPENCAVMRSSRPGSSTSSTSSPASIDRVGLRHEARCRRAAPRSPARRRAAPSSATARPGGGRVVGDLELDDLEPLLAAGRAGARARSAAPRARSGAGSGRSRDTAGWMPSSLKCSQVPRVVDAGDDPLAEVLLLGDLADQQVVLVVAGDRDRRGRRAGCRRARAPTARSRRRTGRRARAPARRSGSGGGPARCSVTSWPFVEQLAREVPADLAGAGDDRRTARPSALRRAPPARAARSRSASGRSSAGPARRTRRRARGSSTRAITRGDLEAPLGDLGDRRGSCCRRWWRR